VIGALVSTALAACALFPALDGYRGDGGAADATSDAQQGSDAGNEASTCATIDASGVILCDDFDESTAITAPRHKSEVGGTVVIDGKQFSSPPNAAHILGSVDGGSVDLFLRESPAPPVTTVSVSFRFMIANWKLSSYHRTAEFNINGGNTLKLNIAVGSLVLTEMDAKYAEFNHPFHSIDATDGKWHSATLRADLTKTPVAVSLKFDNVIMDAANTLIMTSSWQSGPVNIHLGPSASSAGSPPVEIFYDDVIVSTQ
jgi:hypothetical protein